MTCIYDNPEEFATTESRDMPLAQCVADIAEDANLAATDEIEVGFGLAARIDHLARLACPRFHAGLQVDQGLRLAALEEFNLV